MKEWIISYFYLRRREMINFKGTEPLSHMCPVAIAGRANSTSQLLLGLGVLLSLHYVFVWKSEYFLLSFCSLNVQLVRNLHLFLHMPCSHE